MKRAWLSLPDMMIVIPNYRSRTKADLNLIDRSVVALQSLNKVKSPLFSTDVLEALNKEIGESGIRYSVTESPMAFMVGETVPITMDVELNRVRDGKTTKRLLSVIVGNARNPRN